MSYVWNWIKGTIDYLFPFLFKKKASLLFLGLDNAGKSTLLFRLKENRMATVAPTPLPHSEELVHGNVTFTAIDVGGHKQARVIWRQYMYAADGIVFIMDGNARKRFDEVKAELDGIMRAEECSSCPIAVLVNKIDLQDCASSEEIVTSFGLYDKITGKDIDNLWQVKKEEARPLEVFDCSVLKCQGYGQAFRWLAHNVNSN